MVSERTSLGHLVREVILSGKHAESIAFEIAEAIDMCMVRCSAAMAKSSTQVSYEMWSSFTTHVNQQFIPFRNFIAVKFTRLRRKRFNH